MSKALLLPLAAVVICGGMMYTSSSHSEQQLHTSEQQLQTRDSHCEQQLQTLKSEHAISSGAAKGLEERMLFLEGRVKSLQGITEAPKTAEASVDGMMFGKGYVRDFLEDAPRYDPNMPLDQIARTAEGWNWAHTFELNGYTTKGNAPEHHGSEWGLPLDLTGKTFLDIGTWDGKFSWLAEDRNAAAVVSVDYCCWAGLEYDVKDKPGYLALQGAAAATGVCCSGGSDGEAYKFSHAVRRSKAKAVRINVYDMAPKYMPDEGMYDVVWYCGVIYHLRYPFLALEKVASVTKDMLIIETTMRPDTKRDKRAMVIFYSRDQLSRDWTNWVDVNPSAMKGMLETLGFQVIKMVQCPTLRCRLVLHAFKDPNSSLLRSSKTNYIEIETDDGPAPEVTAETDAADRAADRAEEAAAAAAAAAAVVKKAAEEAAAAAAAVK